MVNECKHDWTGKLVHGGWVWIVRRGHLFADFAPKEKPRVRTCAKCGMSVTYYKFRKSTEVINE